MKNRVKTGWLIKAAAIASPALILASAANGQFRTGSDGRALDANPRAGGNGSNDDNIRRDTGPSQEDIVYNNVTGGRGFRGHINTFDPRAFQGNINGGGTDRFVRNSAGAPLPHTNAPSGYNQARPFYGDSRGVTSPPMGIPMGIGTSGVIVPSRPANTEGAEVYENTVQAQQLVLPMDRAKILASPLAGIRTIAPDELPTAPHNDIMGSQPLDNATLYQMRSELSTPEGGVAPGGQGPKTAAPGQMPTGLPGQTAPGLTAPGQTTPAGQAAAANPNLLPTQNISALPLDKSPGAPANTAISNNALSNAIGTPGSLSTDESLRNRLMLPPPEQQSTVYAEMLRREQAYEQENGGTMTDQQANQNFEAQRFAYDKAKAAGPAQGNISTPQRPGMPPTPQAPGTPPAANQTPTPGAAPGAAPPTPGGTMAVKPQTPQRPGQPPQTKAPTPSLDQARQAQKDIVHKGAATAPMAGKYEPLKVKSLADGVQAKGFKNLLSQAEDLMRQGKFSDAMAQYDAAQQVAPNNPLVKIGRANAELGAAYYLQAETHLREAFKSDPALLAAQYDLKSFFGEDRLQFLIKDLKDIMSADQKQDRPVFLLAYISYNTGNEALALAYLDQADKRSGGADSLYKSLHERWSASPTTQENK